MVLIMVAKKNEWELVPNLLDLTKKLENFPKNTELTEFAQHPPFLRKIISTQKIWEQIEMIISIGPY